MSKKSETILEVLLPAQSPADSDESLLADSASQLYGVLTGLLTGFNETGMPLVDFPLNSSGGFLPARSVVALSENDSGREVILMFEGGDPARPIIMGLVQHSKPLKTEYSDQPMATLRQMEIQADDERVVITAQKEIVLRCGKASITLTRAGKVLIRGAYLLSRSSGVNRIKGGSVQIN